MFGELNNFVKKRTIAKARDLTPVYRGEKNTLIIRLPILHSPD